MKICIINFSGRVVGNCKSIADFICEKYKGEDVKRFDFNRINLTPCGKCNAECFQKRESCPYFAEGAYKIYDSITNADLTYFILPNYCDYPCANYFIFNERSQCYFQGREDLLVQYLSANKKFIVISNTNRTNFTKAFEYQINEGEKPDVLFLSPKHYGKRSIDGNIADSLSALKDIENFIKNKPA